MSDRGSLPLTVTEDLFLGCYSDEEGHGGILRVRGSVPTHADEALALRNPSWLEPFAGFVLACCELPESRLAVLRLTDDGAELVSGQPTGGADACHLAVSPDEQWVAVANYTSGQVTLFRAPVDGRLEPATCLHSFTGSGPVTGRQDSAHAHQVTWLDATHFLVNDLGADQLHVLRVDDGDLVELDPVVLPAGMGPRHCLLRQEGDEDLHLVVCGELSGEVVAVRHEGNDWGAGWWVMDRVAGSNEPGAQPSGLRFFGDDLVLGNRGVQTVSLLRWTPEGRLSLVAEAPTGGQHPRDVAVHDGLVWVANQYAGGVTVLRCAADEFTPVAQLDASSPASLLFRSR